MHNQIVCFIVVLKVVSIYIMNHDMLFMSHWNFEVLWIWKLCSFALLPKHDDYTFRSIRWINGTVPLFSSFYSVWSLVLIFNSVSMPMNITVTFCVSHPITNPWSSHKMFVVGNVVYVVAYELFCLPCWGPDYHYPGAAVKAEKMFSRVLYHFCFIIAIYSREGFKLIAIFVKQRRYDFLKILEKVNSLPSSFWK